MPALGLRTNHRQEDLGKQGQSPGLWHALGGRAGTGGPGFERCMHFGGSKTKSDIRMCVFVLVPV